MSVTIALICDVASPVPSRPLAHFIIQLAEGPSVAAAVDAATPSFSAPILLRVRWIQRENKASLHVVLVRTCAAVQYSTVLKIYITVTHTVYTARAHKRK